MRPISLLAALAIGVGLAACGSDRSTPTAPVSASRSGDVRGTAQRMVAMRDECDGPSFNAAIGPETCSRKSGMLFSQFIARLQQIHTAPAWRFLPPTLDVGVGTTLLAVNQGGEVHTFTEVAHFGGGIVPLLNQLSNNPNVAPECLALESDDFVPPGGTYPVDEDDVGTEFYQCCIHPCMRTTVHIHG